ncbi:hypothetical protein NLG97_g4189 [Lecanicillium saksenae]|uniref:Uncharacterized protein n=1 Tax=Lecanicillium saksenae TaxID=468837 RepID=A0ACC1QW66_9HYPO|nr:hypothetical protein NLG97_g4189 [Lecanicillium saksenae]
MARPTRRPGEASPQGVYQLGVQGRKTGATLKDTGERDSEGMMPTRGLFSSPGGDTPQAPAAVPTRERIPQETPHRGGDDDESTPMQLASSDGPGPQTVLRKSMNFNLPIPKGRSPVKSNANSLRSPARRPPNMSPIHPSPADPTINRINTSSPSRGGGRPIRPSFIDQLGSDPTVPVVDPGATIDSRSLQPSTGMSEKAKGKQRAVISQPPKPQPIREPTPLTRPPSSPSFPGDEPGLYVPEPEPSPSPEPEPPQPPSSPGIARREPSIPRPSPGRHTQKRPAPAALTTGSTGRGGEGNPRGSTKRPRQAGSVVSQRSEQPVKRGRGRPPKNGVAKRGRGRPRKSEIDSDGEEGDSIMALQRGPPMPKSRGLVSMRRDAAAAVENSRRGNDADWWADIQVNDRAYDSALSRGQRLGSQTAARHPRGSTATRAHEEEEELEEWEVNPGTVTGEVVLWEPDHETDPPGPDDPVQVTDERIAIAADAVEWWPIKESEVRYAKPLAMPFIGAGMVDLPPGSEKRPKNSRKMHMVFFVHYGKVTVSINELQFRISSGGMWFVPRGNYYNISNEHDLPARVYFAQASEVSLSSAPAEDMTQSIVA